MIHKNRYNRRKIAYYKSKRKQQLIKNIYGQEVCMAMKVEESPLRLSKSKIHCSCGLCSRKSKRIGKKKVNSIETYPISDRKKIMNYSDQLNNY